MQAFVAWIKGLVSVAISAAAGGVAMVVVDPSTFNLHAGIGKLGEVCGVLALTHAAMYLARSPLPGVNMNGSEAAPPAAK